MIKAKDLTVGAWFRDPHREDGRPAYVVEILAPVRESSARFILDDGRPWGPWTASYGADEELEPCEPLITD